MATLHLLHGMVGSGKTSFARKLERERPAVRFTHDEWMVALRGRDPPAVRFAETAATIWDLIWIHAERVLRVGADVVLDGGFWTRAERDDARRRAAALGAACILYDIRCPEAVARARTLRRTAEMPAGALFISDATFDALKARIEPLGPDEPHVIVAAGAEPAASVRP